MPFTLSHPAILLPFFKNKKLSATALIVGSMSPDFEYFFRMRMQSEISHTFLGIFLIDFPLGFIVMFAFHQIIKRPFIENAPLFFQKRLAVLKDSNWINYFKNNFLTVLISFFLGAVSHIFWDSMTHWDGYLVQQTSFFNIEFFSIPVYKIAQHLSSIIGLLYISRYVYSFPSDNRELRVINLNYWYLAFLFSVFAIAVRFYVGTELNKIGNTIVSVISSMIIAVTLVVFLFRSGKAI
jgi:hypothetical protein